MSKAATLALEPRLLSRELAAAYCGVSVPTFEAECPVIPVKIRSRVLYDRVAIDAWLDSFTADRPKSTLAELLGKLEDADARPGN
jgi:hypothetical protein